MDLRNPEIVRKIDSLTKYPSIETYHELDGRPGNQGTLTEMKNHVFPSGKTIVLTEKIDGTNARIVVFPDGDWIVGSRRELLTAKGDRIHNPALGIVDTVRPFVDGLRPLGADPKTTVYYGEVYGHGIEGGKQYTRTPGVTGFRVFDIQVIEDLDDKLTWDLERISSWRERGHQYFVSNDILMKLDFGRMPSGAPILPTPRVYLADANLLPDSVEAAYNFLWMYQDQSRVMLDVTGSGKAEGLVVRTTDRETIAKMRFQDYERTLRKRGYKIPEKVRFDGR